MMKNNPLKKQSILNKKGVTLIELLVVLVICAIVIGGIYKVIIAQTRAYTVQDQVAEVQQDVRGAMEMMVRDIRMAGFQTNNFSDATITSTPIIPDPANDSHIIVNYEYIPYAARYQVDYQVVNATSPNCPKSDLCCNPPCLQHTCTSFPSVPGSGCIGTTDILLENVTNLRFSYGIDANGDGIIDNIDPLSGIVDNTVAVPNNTFVSAANVGTARVLAIYVSLIAKPASTGLSPVDPDVTTMVSKRILTSVVTPRNIFFKRFQAN